MAVILGLGLGFEFALLGLLRLQGGRQFGVGTLARGVRGGQFEFLGQCSVHLARQGDQSGLVDGGLARGGFQRRRQFAALHLQRGQLGGRLRQLRAGLGLVSGGLRQRRLGALEHRLVVDPEFFRVGVLGLQERGPLAVGDPLAQRVEQLQHRHFARFAAQRAQVQQRLGRLIAHQQHAQSVRVLHFERRVALAQLFPQLPYAEAALAHHGVVEQHHAARRHLRQP